MHWWLRSTLGRGDRKLSFGVHRRELVDRDVCDPRSRRTVCAPCKELGDGRGVALRLELDAAIGAVADPADEAEPARFDRRRRAKRHALNAARDVRADPASHPATVARSGRAAAQLRAELVEL